MKVELFQDVDACLRRLDEDVVDFVDPGLHAAYESFLAAFRRFIDEETASSMFPPVSGGPMTYYEVPPEWQLTDPERYVQTLHALGQARDDLLDRYKELMNTMSQQGHMSDPPAPSGQSIHVTAGDSSPVTVSAPYASATGSGSATAGLSPAADARAPWYRSGVFWSAVSAIAAVAAVIVTILLAT
ncbi:hypothetical protein AB0J38_02120 [Streptomyces sp. NPDC050095]